MAIEQLIDDLIAREGGYSDRAADRGGPTIWGVTEAVARAYGYTGSMKSMPRPTAATIYRTRYWTAPGFDKVAARSPTLAAELFDAGVNMGPATAGKFLQRSLNVLNRGQTAYPDVVADGGVGAMTLAALDGYRRARPGAEGDAVLLWLVRALRAGRYVDIAEADPTQEANEYGWIARQARMAA